MKRISFWNLLHAGLLLLLFVDLEDGSEVLTRNANLFKISDFHGGDYEELFLLGCYAMWPL
jgi:hypothetical protein